MIYGAILAGGIGKRIERHSLSINQPLIDSISIFIVPHCISMIIGFIVADSIRLHINMNNRSLMQFQDIYRVTAPMLGSSFYGINNFCKAII